RWNAQCERKKLARTRDLYRHIASLTRPKSAPPKSLTSPTGDIVYETRAKADLLVSTFASYFTIDDGTLPTLSTSPLPLSLSKITFLPPAVLKALRKLRPSGSCAADSIPQIIFAKCASSLALPLCDIFNWSVFLGSVPSIWKHS